MAPTRWRLLLSAMLIVSVRGFHAPASARRSFPTRRAASPAACDTPAPSNLRTALLIGGAGSTAAWTATASFALCTYKPHRWTHNLIGVSQALTALPLLWACLAVLHAAAKPDGDGLSLRSPEQAKPAEIANWLHLNVMAGEWDVLAWFLAGRVGGSLGTAGRVGREEVGGRETAALQTQRSSYGSAALRPPALPTPQGLGSSHRLLGKQL